MKTFRVSTNVVAWIGAETPEGALAMLIEQVQKSDRPDGTTIEAISVEDVYDVSVVEKADGRE